MVLRRLAWPSVAGSQLRQTIHQEVTYFIHCSKPILDVGIDLLYLTGLSLDMMPAEMRLILCWDQEYHTGM
jgi:hypothetical protein